MRAQPKNRDARAGGTGIGREVQIGWKHKDSQTLPTIQAPLFTAIPLGVRTWAVKVVAPTGEETRLGRFDDRLHALGAAVLLAAQACGGVRP